MWKKPVAKEPQSEADKRQQALVTANVVINDNRAKLRKPMDQYQQVANSNYWFYGYSGSCMLASMAAALALSSRVPILARAAPWVALFGGYYQGKFLHGLHNQYNLSQVVKVIDDNIQEMKKLDEKNHHAIPDYAREIESLTKMKHDLQPHTEEAKVAAATATMQSQMSIDERAEALIAAYERRQKR